MEVRIIKRYANRKLYDTSISEYITLDDIRKMVESGQRVQVIDRKSNEDLTAQMLTQIILEKGKRGEKVISSDILHDLLRKGQTVIDTVIDNGLNQLKDSVEDIVKDSRRRVDAFLGDRNPDDISQLQQQLSELDKVLTQVLNKNKENEK